VGQCSAGGQDGGDGAGLLSSAASIAGDDDGDGAASGGPIPATAERCRWTPFSAVRTEDGATFEANMDTLVAATRRRAVVPVRARLATSSARVGAPRHRSGSAADPRRALKDDNAGAACRCCAPGGGRAGRARRRADRGRTAQERAVLPARPRRRAPHVEGRRDGPVRWRGRRPPLGSPRGRTAASAAHVRC